MLIEDFSAGYWLVPGVSVMSYSGEKAVCQDELFFDLLVRTGRDPLIGSTGGRHFELFPERSVPADAVAVPEGVFGAVSDAALLISKENGGRVIDLA